MSTLLLAYPGNEQLTNAIHHDTQWPIIDATITHFPDGESHIRVTSQVAELQGAEVVVVCTLDQPNTHLIPLSLLVHTLRDLGAQRVQLVAPYLSYMRQDERFHPGEGVTSRYVAAMLSQWVDELWTMAPHLHRHDDLGALYHIPTHCLDVSPAIAAWVEQLDRPLLIGPDDESEQWVRAVAQHHQTPYIIFDKVRRGDRDVELTHRGHLPEGQFTPVIIDDIISTGQTMAKAVQWTQTLGLGKPHCVGIHAVFADDATTLLLEHGAQSVITCNTIAHTTNQVDVHPIFAQALKSI